MKRKILLVEDDYDLSETIFDFLEMMGFEVVSVKSSDEAIKEIYEKNFDLMLLDVKIIGKNGFEVSKEIRKNSTIPIIFITSLNSEKDLEEGFLSGGDDYLKKPFSLKELNLRIEAVMRRIYREEKIELGDGFCFFPKTMELKKDGKNIHLKNKIAKLLNLFIKYKNEPLSKQFILDNLYEYNETQNEASLRTFIKTLRTIFSNKRIETIKNVGYKFVW